MAVANSAVTAYIAILPPGIGMVTFPYHPEEFTTRKTAEWHTTPHPARGTPSHQYQGSQAQTIDVKILLDMFAIPPMPPQLNITILEQTVTPNPINKVAGKPMPPNVLFGWGPNIIMEEAIVKSMSVSYKRFLLGIPVRAEVTLSLASVPSPIPGTNPTSGGLATRRTHTVIEGDTLASISYREYGDAGKWRALAIANGIDDPMRLRPGTELFVPEAREIDTLT
jgi:hypothetical protein